MLSANGFLVSRVTAWRFLVHLLTVLEFCFEEVLIQDLLEHGSRYRLKTACPALFLCHFGGDGTRELTAGSRRERSQNDL